MPVATLLAHAALLARLAAPPIRSPSARRCEYEARLGIIPVGSATMSVNPMTRERGNEAFVFAASARVGRSASGSARS